MKTPRLKELKRLNERLKKSRWNNYRPILGASAVLWSRLSGDTKVIGFVRSRQWRKLYEYVDSLRGTVYSTAALHFAASQLIAVVRKFPWDPALIGTDPEGTAISSFMAAEHRCKWVNRWFRARRRCFDDTWEQPLSRIRGFVRYVLGDMPNLPEIYDLCDLTEGANLGVHGDATNLSRKLLAKSWSVTPSALPYFAAALCHNVHFATKVARGNGVVQSLWVSDKDLQGSCDLVAYNKVAFVPKDAGTFRSVATEPLGNGYLQKGTDLQMRKHLKRVGFDLSDQSLNQRLACEGSVDESEDGFCTIDLKEASNSICTEFVKEALPPEWFCYLERIRSPMFRLPSGKDVRYEKFCSMGNGFCFPLQTLLFASICHAANAGKPGVDYAVYGDDIIVRRKVFEDVVLLLKRFGFKTNSRKTFSQGPFRESCGANWYKGEDVTPFTLDFELDSLSSMFKAINLARRNSATSRVFSSAVAALIKRLPEEFRFFRPFKGPVDTGIDLLDLQFKPSWGRSSKFQCPEWWELHSRPIEDDWWRSIPDNGWVVMAGAVRGHPRLRMFTFRRTVEMRVRRVARSGDVTPWDHDPALRYGGVWRGKYRA